MHRLTAAIPLLLLPLAACSFGGPPSSPQQQAEQAACAQRADAIDAARNYAPLSRTDQFATPLIGAPNPDYLDHTLARRYERHQRIEDCLRNGNEAYVGSGKTLPQPRIVGPEQ